ncbi:MAG: sigma-70 family RNA polymerase sigma factor [candidate division Zixibacteria bacterium]|nr:RNA polymerase sigma factor [candidate division Zixibacteria bacterium]NIW40478.1 sigma-70 family RNA polymerase sigma factor [candidate division Zixibacteria bacterium]NIX57801.1 sigma-70 family RNA polymerase sigma factor [candidate division Zixibacteria bacterium]
MNGKTEYEDLLFKMLSERFNQFAHHRIWNADDAEDIVQEALMVIANEFKQLEIRTSFAAWSYKVLNNRILSYIEAKGRNSIRKGMVDLNSVDLQASSSNPDLRLRLINCLKKIDNVNKRHARIINLHHLGFSIDEICTKLTLSRNAVYIILHRVRRMLECCIETGDISE